jgi:hypothetical protein
MALDGGGWSTPRPGRFTPGNDPIKGKEHTTQQLSLSINIYKKKLSTIICFEGEKDSNIHSILLFKHLRLLKTLYENT